MPSQPGLDPEYFDSPYLTAAVNICSAIGVFVGAWTAILLLGALHRGFDRYWPFVLIIGVDVAVNIGVRVARHRRSHKTDASRSAPDVQGRLQPR